MRKLPDLEDFDGQAVAELGLAFGHDGFPGREAGKDFGPAVVLESGLDFAGEGLAVLHDEDGRFARRCNTSMVTLDQVLPRSEQAGPAVGWHREMADEVLLKKLVEDHHKWTGSLRAREILDTWPQARAKFVKVFPHEYKRVLAERAARAEAAAATGKAMTSAASVAAK